MPTLEELRLKRDETQSDQPFTDAEVASARGAIDCYECHGGGCPLCAGSGRVECKSSYTTVWCPCCDGYCRCSVCGCSPVSQEMLAHLETLDADAERETYLESLRVTL